MGAYVVIYLLLMQKKLCPKCNKKKFIKHFYKREKNKPSSYCKVCFNELCIERWRQRKLDAIKLLGGKCVDCKQSYHPNIYDFHHLDGKDYDWNQLRLRAKTTIISELSKCVLVCANCHRLRHTND